MEGVMARLREQVRPRTPEEIAAAKERELQDAFTVARVLDNPQGKELLDLLYRKFGHPIEFDPSIGENAANLGFYRSGQGSVLNYLGQMIARARGGGKANTTSQKVRRSK